MLLSHLCWNSWEEFGLLCCSLWWFVAGWWCCCISYSQFLICLFFSIFDAPFYVLLLLLLLLQFCWSCQWITLFSGLFRVLRLSTYKPFQVLMLLCFSSSSSSLFPLCSSSSSCSSVCVTFVLYSFVRVLNSFLLLAPSSDVPFLILL